MHNDVESLGGLQGVVCELCVTGNNLLARRLISYGVHRMHFARQSLFEGNEKWSVTRERQCL